MAEMKKTSDKEKADLFREHRQMVKGLLYPTDADKKVSPVFWTKEEVGDDTLGAGAARRLMKASPDEPVREMSLEEFFAPVKASADWDEEHKANADRFQALRKWLEEHIQEPKVYRMGDSTAILLLAGKTEAGDFAGLATLVVET